MKQMDEMGRNIRLRSEALGYKAAVLCLAIWTLYESWQTLSHGGAPNILPMMIYMVAMGVQRFSEMAMNRQMTAEDEEYKEPNKLLRTVVATVAIAAMVCSIGSYLMLKLN